MRDSLSSSSMSMRAEEAPNAARGLAFPISSSVHHRTCAADAELPSRARMVSAAHCRTPWPAVFGADAARVGAAAAAHGRSEQAKRVDSIRVLACELHANRSAVFGPDQMTGPDFQRIQEACDVGGELAGAPAVPGRLGRGAEARQVETNDTVLFRQMRHPRDPGGGGLGVAMHHHDGLGNAPRLAEPIVLVSDPYARPDLHLVHRVAPICGSAAWA